MREIKGRHRLFPLAPCGVREGDIVYFFAHRRWYDFLFKSRRNRPFELGSARVKMVDPVMNQVWYEDAIPHTVLPGDYMLVESCPN
jgi:hypothetical protein